MIKLERFISWVAKNFSRIFCISIWIVVTAFIVYVIKQYLIDNKNEAKGFMFFATMIILAFLFFAVTGWAVLTFKMDFNLF